MKLKASTLLNTYASPTPCIEKGFVYVHYGSMGTACINTDKWFNCVETYRFQMQACPGSGFITCNL